MKRTDLTAEEIEDQSREIDVLREKSGPRLHEVFRKIWEKLGVNPSPLRHVVEEGLIDLRLAAEFSGLRRRELEDRVKAIEDGGIRYRGVYQRADAYKRGDVTTDQGSAWIALKDISGERPGTGDAWQLMVKAGRDAR